MSWYGSLSGGEWLLGVYDGKLVTASDREARTVRKNLRNMRLAGFFGTAAARNKMIPFFFMLAPAKDPRVAGGDRNLLSEHGLRDLAYKYGGFEAPAYGHIARNVFFLDKKAAEKCGMSPDRVSVGTPFTLALMSKTYSARTGTFFKAVLRDGKIGLAPCTHDRKCLSGKGILLGAKADILLEAGYREEGETIGAMDPQDAEREMECPASRMNARFRECGKDYSIVYRESLTDLRADMPLAYMKLAKEAGAFERMFAGLGASVLREFGKTFDELKPWNVLMDGTIVDYCDLPDRFDITGDGHHSYLEFANIELGRMALFAAAASAGAAKRITGVRSGKAGLDRLRREMLQDPKVAEQYGKYLDRFMEGMGERKYAQYFSAAREMAGIFKK